MTSSTWKIIMEDLLDGVERELRSSVPVKIRVALNTFRLRLSESRVAKRRKHFEQELEAFLQSEPFLRAATKRYLRKKIPSAIERAVATIKRALAFLTTDRTKRRA
jgi:hypothetical protein